jgi:hypothetical protein
MAIRTSLLIGALKSPRLRSTLLVISSLLDMVMAA